MNMAKCWGVRAVLSSVALVTFATSRCEMVPSVVPHGPVGTSMVQLFDSSVRIGK